jgi:hypothetical protein
MDPMDLGGKSAGVKGYGEKAVDTRLIALKIAYQYKIFLREWG